MQTCCYHIGNAPCDRHAAGVVHAGSSRAGRSLPHRQIRTVYSTWTSRPAQRFGPAPNCTRTLWLRTTFSNIEGRDSRAREARSPSYGSGADRLQVKVRGHIRINVVTHCQQAIFSDVPSAFVETYRSGKRALPVRAAHHGGAQHWERIASCAQEFEGNPSRWSELRTPAGGRSHRFRHPWPNWGRLMTSGVLRAPRSGGREPNAASGSYR